MSGATLLLPTERHDLLVRLLRFDPQPEQISALRFELLSDIRAMEAVMSAASRRQLVSAAISQLKLNGILRPKPAHHGERETITTQIGRLDAEFSQRRALLTRALQDIIARLNDVGIEPLILKGAMSLISGEPDWRFQRDIDFAIYPLQAGATVAALAKAGFSECEHSGPRPHHLRPMERTGLPATIEPHVKLAGARAQSVLPDEILLQTESTETWRGLKYRRLSDAGFVLHGLAHHHYQNRGYIYGTFSLKGLLEFASAVSRLDAAAVSQLAEIASPRARL
ncbi:MAG: nucleotidyltransferase family protein, partial [Pseudomonadota bacterium]